MLEKLKYLYSEFTHKDHKLSLLDTDNWHISIGYDKEYSLLEYRKRHSCTFHHYWIEVLKVQLEILYVEDN